MQHVEPQLHGLRPNPEHVPCLRTYLKCFSLPFHTTSHYTTTAANCEDQIQIELRLQTAKLLIAITEEEARDAYSYFTVTEWISAIKTASTEHS